LDVEKLLAVLVEKGKSFLFTEAVVTVFEHLDNDVPLISSSTITCDYA
jgi:ariadne-1